MLQDLNFFITKEKSADALIKKIESLGGDLFKFLSSELSSSFAKSFIFSFDYLSILKKENDIQYKIDVSFQSANDSFFKSLELGIFPKIEAYIFTYNDLYFVALSGLDCYFGVHEIIRQNKFLKFKRILSEDERQIKNFFRTTDNFEEMSWKNTVINPKTVAISDEWFNFVPSLNDRAVEQTINLFLQNKQKEKDLSLLEIINFRKEVQSHHQFPSVKEKIIKILEKSSPDISKKLRN